MSWTTWNDRCITKPHPSCFVSRKWTANALIRVANSKEIETTLTVMGLEKSFLVVIMLFKLSHGLTGKCMLNLLRLATKTNLCKLHNTAITSLFKLNFLRFTRFKGRFWEGYFVPEALRRKCVKWLYAIPKEHGIASEQWSGMEKSKHPNFKNILMKVSALRFISKRQI